MKVQEKETITMEVELSKADVEGSWSKDAKKLKAGPNIIITALGNKHCLTMSQLKISDGGTITFQAEDAHTSGKLIVTGECVYWAALSLSLNSKIQLDHKKCVFKFCTFRSCITNIKYIQPDKLNECPQYIPFMLIASLVRFI